MMRSRVFSPRCVVTTRLVVTAACLASCFVARSAPGAPAPASPAPASPADTEPRFSLTLREAPLSQLLEQVSAATSLRFRYATPPDATVSASFQNAPLFSALETALRAQGFSLLRDGEDAWILRLHERAPRAMVPLSLPPRATKKPLPRLEAARPEVRVVSEPDDGWTMRVAPNDWRRVAFEANARRFPGVAILPSRAPLAPGLSRLAPWLRDTLRLRSVPPRLRLLLQTDRPATLLVNGAVLRRDWQGRAAFELSGALRPGLNRIEVRWNAGGHSAVWRPVSLRPVDEERPAEERAPSLRYEWLLGDASIPPNGGDPAARGGLRFIGQTRR